MTDRSDRAELERALADGSRDDRMAALELALEAGWTDVVRAALANSSGRVRIAACDALAERKALEPEDVDALRNVMTGGDLAVRGAAFLALWRHDVPMEPDLDLIARLLASRREDVVTAAAWTVRDGGLAEGVADALVAALRYTTASSVDPWDRVRMWAALVPSAAAAGPIAIEALHGDLDHDEDMRRTVAAWVLAETGPPAAVAIPTLEARLASDPEEPERWHVTEALARIRGWGEDLEPGLREGLRETTSETCWKSLVLIARVGPAALPLADTVAPLWNVRNREQRVVPLLALHALERMGACTPGTVEELGYAMRDGILGPVARRLADRLGLRERAEAVVSVAPSEDACRELVDDLLSSLRFHRGLAIDGSRRSIQAATRARGDADGRRRRAWTRLHALGPLAGSAVPLVVAELERRTDTMLIEVLGAIGAADPAARAALDRIVERGGRDERAAARAALGAWPEREDDLIRAFPRILHGALPEDDDDDRYMRRRNDALSHLAGGISKLGPRAQVLVPEVAAHVGGDPDDIEAGMIEALGAIDATGETAIPILVRVLLDARVREHDQVAAAHALGGRIDLPDSAVHALAQAAASADSPDAVAIAAMIAIARFGPSGDAAWSVLDRIALPDPAVDRRMEIREHALAARALARG